MSNLKYVAIILTMLAACDAPYSPASLVQQDQHAVVDCHDTRDGERFTIQAKNVTNIRVNIVGSSMCFDAVDDAGKQWHLCSEMEAYVKCQKRSDAR